MLPEGAIYSKPHEPSAMRPHKPRQETSPHPPQHNPLTAPAFTTILGSYPAPPLPVVSRRQRAASPAEAGPLHGQQIAVRLPGLPPVVLSLNLSPAGLAHSIA